MNPAFTEVQRPHGPAWLHNSGDKWIVHYNAVSPPFYQAYRAIDTVPKGRMPWTIDNRRIGTPHGFKTLEQAMAAVTGETS